MSTVPDSYGAQLAWEGVLDEIEDYLAQREDIRDGGDGTPLPNEEMRLLSDLRWWRPKASQPGPSSDGGITQALVAMARANAIEECAKVCDAEWQGTSSLCRSKTAGDLAKRIRAIDSALDAAVGKE